MCIHLLPKYVHAHTKKNIYVLLVSLLYHQKIVEDEKIYRKIILFCICGFWLLHGGDSNPGIMNNKNIRLRPCPAETQAEFTTSNNKKIAIS